MLFQNSYQPSKGFVRIASLIEALDQDLLHILVVNQTRKPIQPNSSLIQVVQPKVDQG